jgi:hypothetical protein
MVTGKRSAAAAAAQLRKKSAGRKPRPARARAAAATPPAPSTVVLQARVDAAFAAQLLEQDAPTLGIDGASDLVREGLRLVHRRAQEQALIDSYDTFHAGMRAPLPAGVADADTD